MSTRAAEYRFVLRHWLVYGVGSILSQVASFLLLPVYTSYLTPSDYGILELLGTTSSLFGIVLGLGASSVLARFFHRTHDEGQQSRVVSTLTLLVAGAGFCGSLACVVFADPLSRFLFGSGDWRGLVVLAMLSVAVGLSVDLCLVYLRVLHRSTLYVAVSLAQLLFTVAANLLLLAQFGAGVWAMFIGGLAVRLGFLCPLLVVVFRRVGVHFDWGVAREMVSYSLPLVPSRLFSVLASQADRWFIATFVALAEAGLFGLAQRFALVMHLLVYTPFTSVFETRRYELARRGDGPLRLAQIFDLHVAASAFVGLGVAAFAGDVIGLMTASAFHSAASYVGLAVVGNLLFGLLYHLEFGLLLVGNTRRLFVANSIRSVLQFCLAATTVPKYGVMAALWSAIVALLLGGCVLWRESQKVYPIPFNWPRVAVVMACGVSSYYLTTAASGLPAVWGIATKLLVVGVAFPASLVLTRAVPFEELAEIPVLRDLFARRRTA